MKMRFTLCAIVLLAAIPASMALAGGLGGVGYGLQYFDPQYSSADTQYEYITGYGYAVNWQGARFGGFGTALISANGTGAGGVGGIIMGHEWNAGPLTAALSLWAGLGGGGFARSGYMLGFGEADFELGVRVFPWMQITAYGGYQAWGNIVPGFPFSRVFYSPVVGIRFGWGG